MNDSAYRLARSPRQSLVRKFLLATVSAIAAVALTNATAEAKEASPVAKAMTQAAQEYLSSLTPEQKAVATMDYDNPERMDWHNIPKEKRKGLQFKNMDAKQRQLCLGLLQASLSGVGYEKATRIMSLEANLREGEKNLKGGHLRDPERYFLTIFGTPSTEGDWGYSFEGHHLSLNFAVHNGQVVGDTPSFWGANPATVHVYVAGGPEVGTRTLAKEEQLAIDLVGSLDKDQFQKAMLSADAPKEYRGGGEAKAPEYLAEGLAYSDMNPNQQKVLRDLLTTYSANLAPNLAKTRLTAIEDSGWERVHFAWAGSTKPGVGHYYRIQGPTFVLELVNVQEDPQGNPANHIHSVWRNTHGDFGTARP